MTDEQTQATSLEAARGRRQFPRRTRVLIVDDLAENRAMLGLCCDRFGLMHEWAADGREAVEQVRSGRFDLVLMDILMPRLDGFGATRAIRALDAPICSVPIIALASAAAPGEVLRYLACGMTDVVPKPIVADRLAAVMSSALAESRRKRKAPTPRAAA